MASSRYRKAATLREKFPYRLNPRTNKALLLSFFGDLGFANPRSEVLASMDYIEVPWSIKDSLAGLAAKHYGDAAYWWLIALVNNVSSDHDIPLGHSLTILFPPDELMREFGL